MDRNLALEFVRVTEAGAIAAASWMGRGDGKLADGAAVDEMRDRLNQIDFNGRVVIGEGDKDESPKLFIGEKVGKGGGPEMDIAVDPLEATDSVAYGRTNALSVIVTGPKGSLLHAPDTYMDKLAAGPEARGVIDLDAPVKDNIVKTAKVLGKEASEIVVVVLDRPRHEQLVNDIRKAGARVRLITDGDIAAAIATCLPNSGIDILMGIGASAESVLAAAAVKVYGGEILTRFKPRSQDDEVNIKKHGIVDLNEILNAEKLARGEMLTFTATGVIDGPLLDGVRVGKDFTITHSVVMRKASGTVRYLTTHHRNK